MTPYCHAIPDGDCLICRRYLTDAAFRAIVDVIPAFAPLLKNVAKVSKSPEKKFIRLKDPCVHLGVKVPGRPCGTDLYECGYDDSLCSKYKGCTEAKRKCEICNHYVGGSSLCS